jgi:hypothetical protein
VIEWKKDNMNRPSSLWIYPAALILACLPAFAQGIAPEWEIRKTLATISSDLKRISPIFEQLRPAEWVKAGASETYTQQLKSTQEQLDGARIVIGSLSRTPEKLGVAVDAYFRLETLEMMLGSLGDGLRRYQNPALADLLAGTWADGSGSRMELRKYVHDLASVKDDELAVMDREAQACRTQNVRRPAARKKTGGNAKK